MPSAPPDQAAAMMDAALRDADIPLDGVAVLNTSGSTEGYPADWHLVLRADNYVVRIDYHPAATPGDVITGDGIVRDLDLTLTRVRSMYDIYADIKALTPGQQAAIANDISADGYAKLKDMRPPQDAPVAVLHWCVTSLAAATQAERYDAYARISSMYCQQYPDYLMNPPFDPTIEISGDEPVP
jgi:hypothetical protein